MAAFHPTRTDCGDPRAGRLPGQEEQFLPRRLSGRKGSVRCDRRGVRSCHFHRHATMTVLDVEPATRSRKSQIPIVFGAAIGKSSISQRCEEPDPSFGAAWLLQVQAPAGQFQASWAGKRSNIVRAEWSDVTLASARCAVVGSWKSKWQSLRRPGDR